MRSAWLLVVLLGVMSTLSCQQQSTAPPAPDTAASETSASGPAAESGEPESSAQAESATAANRSTEGAASAPRQEIGPGLPELQLSREEIEAGWIQLFDGQTLFGWKANNDVNWSVSDGVITADTGEPGLLLTTVPFADYELRCDFRLEKGGNSGIFLRTLFDRTNPEKDCYELNICDSHPDYPTGSLVGRQRIEEPVQVEGEWKTYHVRVQGPRVEVKLDGRVILEFEDTSEPSLRNGLIGLQKNAGKIEFRNIFLRPLETTPIFNGEDLTGWREVPGSKSQFEVIDGKIHVTNGPGFLETEQTWANFVLQVDAITNGQQLNSGIFFRAMSGTEEAPSHGYEMQIQNGYKDEDRTQPVDQGTGAIFRRSPARLVIPNNEEWFTATLVAYGPHFAVWVDGYPVTNWTDQREPHENPRRGQRLEAGHISLQGHDPTTNLDFKNLRLAAYPDGRLIELK